MTESIEKQIQAKGLTAPRITPADLAANIVDVEIVKHVTISGKVLRWAVITTRNGYAVTGKPAVAVSPENDDAEIGVSVATANAKQEMWALMGYELQTRLAQPVLSEEDALADLTDQPRPSVAG